MKFQVPQFIEIEDKIFGPFTIKQFVYIVGAAGISFVLWTLLPSTLALFFIIPIAGLGGALAFYKVNNRPFIFTLESAFYYILRERLYLWKKEVKKGKESKKKEANLRDPGLRVPKLSESKLKDLAWSLDIKESIYSDKDQQ